MSDLPRWYALENERLRAWAHDERLGHGPLLLDAAAEIERLRDIISPGDAAAYEEGMAALLARCETAEARLAEAHDLLAYVDELRSRLAEAEQLLSACYSPVRRIAEGGSRTREDLDLAAETFAALKRYLKPVAVPADSAPAVTGNCGLCGQPRADHAEVAPDGKPYCRMKSGNAGNIVKHAVSADVVQP